MWRAARVSYLQYSNEMAHILRQCLKEPFREKALEKSKTHIKEKFWANGTIQATMKFDDMSTGFKVATGQEEKK